MLTLGLYFKVPSIKKAGVFSYILIVILFMILEQKLTFKNAIYD